MKEITTERIAEEFQKGFDCSQVVFSSYAEELGISEEIANRVSACFGGGMNRGETCGAIAGALMVLGMKYGQFDEENMEQKNIMAAKREEFLRRFQEKYPSIVCKKLLNYDLTKPEEMEKILEEGLLMTFCPMLVKDVIGILEKI